VICFIEKWKAIDAVVTMAVRNLLEIRDSETGYHIRE
jgi:hypothetical protein